MHHGRVRKRSAFYLQSTWSEASKKSRPAFRAGKMPGRRVNGSKADAIWDYAGNFRPRYWHSRFFPFMPDTNDFNSLHTIDTVKGHPSFLPLACGFVCVRFTLPSSHPIAIVGGHAILPPPLLVDSFHPTAI
ncbi:hypothetical protein TNCV_1837551 [Trichonephila clavipes]|nr:hypothetical protein TNCV_1837551 [Trichonephila clavipes]